MNKRPLAPWEKFPEYEPGDPFWRQTGEHYYHDIWLPYWQGLSRAEQLVLYESSPEGKKW